MLTSRRSVGACRLLCSVAALLAVGAAAERSSARAPSLRDVLARAAEYSAAYGEALSQVVADEDFTQELILRDRGTVLERRRLASEIVFVRLADSAEWLAFRSVLQVDGQPIADAPGRLERMFREQPRSSLAQARAIANESARHNLGPAQRNFNVPTTVLQFLLRQHHDRFRFRKAGEERIHGEPVWIVEFREQDRGTFIRTPEGRSAPSQGLAWIVPRDGRVVRTRLTVKATVQAEIGVTWRADEALAMWVPSEMRESYRGPWTIPAAGGTEDAYDVQGVATYSNYRRFTVDVRMIRE
jgi:hypothetical protein